MKKHDSPALMPLQKGARVAPSAEEAKALRQRALERWENEGGEIPPPDQTPQAICQDGEGSHLAGAFLGDPEATQP